MKYSFLGLGMVLFGITGLAFIVLFQNVTINNESEYYVLKEAVEASMYEAVDLPYFRNSGEVKIIEEKFVSSCSRRFFANISGGGNANQYRLTFYDIMESPPKVSVVASSKTSDYSAVGLGGSDGFNIENLLTGILEYDFDPSTIDQLNLNVS